MHSAQIPNRHCDIIPTRTQRSRKPLYLTTLLAGLATGAADAAPTISRQPADLFPSLGADVEMVVTASGTGTLTYQWRFNNDELAGQTRPRLILTNIASAVAGGYSVVVSDTSGSVTSRVAALKIDPTFSKITTDATVQTPGAFQGIAWSDFDGDGYLDLLIPHWGSRHGYFRNNRDRTFTAMTTDPIARVSSFGVSPAVGDYDNDGFPDAFISNLDGQDNLLFRNTGDGSFLQIKTAERGSIARDGGSSTAASWADYDQDGYIDLVVVGYDSKPFLYRNQGDGTFLKITNSALSAAAISVPLGCPWADIDNDGDPDLFIGNSGNSFIFRNLGEGRFERLTDSIVTRDATSVGGASFGDLDNDGDLDLLALNVMGGRNSVYLNDGSGSFSKFLGEPFNRDSGPSASCTLGDYDNDGWLDIFIANGFNVPRTNFLYRNLGGMRFVRIAEGSLVTDSGPSVGCAWADLDNDGFLDLAVSNGGSGAARNFLYRNNGNANRWIKFHLVGSASNRSAIGARVRVVAEIRSQPMILIREVSTGDGVSGSGPILHFGLGDATELRSVAILWPSGVHQEISGLGLNALHTLSEPPSLKFSGPARIRVNGRRDKDHSIEASADLVLWKQIGTAKGGTDIPIGEYTTQLNTFFRAATVP